MAYVGTIQCLDDENELRSFECKLGRVILRATLLAFDWIHDGCRFEAILDRQELSGVALWLGPATRCSSEVTGNVLLLEQATTTEVLRFSGRLVWREDEMICLIELVRA